MDLLQQTAAPDQIDPAQFDAIYFTGGHAVMWDFPDSAGLQRITLSDGTLLVAGRRLTGFSWREEVLSFA